MYKRNITYEIKTEKENKNNLVLKICQQKLVLEITSFLNEFFACHFFSPFFESKGTAFLKNAYSIMFNLLLLTVPLKVSITEEVNYIPYEICSYHYYWLQNIYALAFFVRYVFYIYIIIYTVCQSE